jgi:hypothetical protein
VGGLTTSTLLTLFVVPVVYTLFDDLARKLRKTTAICPAPLLVGPSVESVERQTLPGEKAPERSGTQRGAEARWWIDGFGPFGGPHPLPLSQVWERGA